MSNPPHIPVANRLLAALPRDEYERLLPHLETVPLAFKQVLYESREFIDQVYFPITGVISLLTILEDGIVGEVGLIGNEGIVGLSVFLGSDTTPIKSFVQVPGNAMRMSADVFKSLKQSDSLHGLLHRYTHALMIQTSQLVACNNYHSVEQRCCRWLLMTRDRVGSNQFPITQEFLSQMLGVRRASVTVVAGLLQKAGLIRYSRGQMTIVNGLGLEKASCKCYRLVKEEFERSLG